MTNYFLVQNLSFLTRWKSMMLFDPWFEAYQIYLTDAIAHTKKRVGSLRSFHTGIPGILKQFKGTRMGITSSVRFFYYLILNEIKHCMIIWLSLMIFYLFLIQFYSFVKCSFCNLYDICVTCVIACTIRSINMIDSTNESMYVCMQYDNYNNKFNSLILRKNKK